MATPQPQSLASLLRRYRRAAGLTQEELAERAGVAVGTIGALERGLSQSPHRDTVALLAVGLGLNEHDRSLLESSARHVLSPAAAPAAQRAKLSPAALPLVGRHRELAVIESYLAGAGAPLLLMAGEPGIGKTRLLQEAAILALDRGWTVLAGGCTRRSGQEPYSPILELLANFLRIRTSTQLRIDLEGCAWLVRLLPELGERATMPAPVWTLPPEQEQRLMFAAVRHLLNNVAGSAGTLLLLDDLQWAGSDTIHLLTSLLHRSSIVTADITAAPLRLFGTYRSTEVRTHDPLGLLAAELAPLGVAKQLVLGPLSTDEASSLLDTLLAGARAGDAGQQLLGTDPEVLQRLITRAEGIPFFLVSCAHEMRSGTLDAAGEGRGDGESSASDGVPWLVAQSIRRRVAALPEPAQLLLGIVAVAGRVVLRTDLFAVARQTGRELADDDNILAALEHLTHAILLTETSDQAYAFAHDLIREVILIDMTAARRELWHRRLGETLERLPEPARRRRAAELAWHFLHGAASDRALTFTLEAGDQAAELYAHDDANRHFQAALALAREVGAPLQEAESLEKRGLILRLLERDHEAVEVFAQAIAAYRKVGDTESMWRVMGQLAGVYGILGMPEKGRALLQPVLEGTQPSAPSKALASMYLEYSWLSWLSGNLEERLATAERTVVVATAAGERRIEGEAEFQRGNTLLMLGRVEEALQSLERAVPLLEATRHLRRLSSTLNVMAGIHKLRGEFGLMQVYCDRALEIALTVGVRSQLRYAWANQGEVQFLLGDWQRAADAFEHALALSDREDDRLESSQVFSGLGWLRLCQGAATQGIGLLEEALARAAMQGAMDLEQALAARAALAEYALVTGNPLTATEWLSPLTALDRTELFGTLWLPLLAWAWLETGRSAEADVLLTETAELATRQSNRLTSSDISRVRAMLAIQTRNWQSAEHSLNEALAVARATPYPYAEAKALYVHAQMAVSKGELALARERLVEAQAILRRLGEGLYAPHIERLLAQVNA